MYGRTYLNHGRTCMSRRTFLNKDKSGRICVNGRTSLINPAGHYVDTAGLSFSRTYPAGCVSDCLPKIQITNQMAIQASKLNGFFPEWNESEAI